jgi:hypothetical protein
MKRNNLTIIATIIAAFGVSIFAFQPAATIEASSGAAPFATPSPRTKKPKPIQSPITVTGVKKPIESAGVDQVEAGTRKSARKSNKVSNKSTDRRKASRSRNAGKRVHKP